LFPIPRVATFRGRVSRGRQCLRIKRNTINALAFEVNADMNLLALPGDLRSPPGSPRASVKIFFYGRSAKAR